MSKSRNGLAGTVFNLYAYAKDTNIDFDQFGLECWSTARKKFWKQEAVNNPHLYSANNIENISVFQELFLE